MKKSILFMMSLAMIVAFSSCSNKEKEVSESSAPVEEEVVELKPVDQTAELSGHVGPGNVSMTLNVKGDLVEGEYSYNKYGKPLKLQGKLEEDGHLELHEVNKDGKPTGHFDGYFDKDSGYSGEFVNFKGSHYSFDLTIDNITDNAGDGDGRGFLATLPADSPARNSVNTSTSENYSDDYDNSDFSENTGDSSIDDLLDTYEKYVDDYIKFIKKAANGDMTAIAEYTRLYKDANEYAQKLEDVKGEMSTAQINRMNRINNKMLEAAQEMQ